MCLSALLCLSAAFSSSLTSATHPQDVASAHIKVSARMFTLAGLLGKQMQPLQALPGSSSMSSAVLQAALRRTQQRAQHAGVDALELIVNGDLQQWESVVCASFAKGTSMDLQPSTAQNQECKVWLLAYRLSALLLPLLTHPQLIQEFRLALWLGRTLHLFR
jgi:hypothetical protein